MTTRADTEAVTELLATLKEARMMVNDWSAYASDYFIQKWDLEGDLSTLDAVIAKYEATS